MQIRQATDFQYIAPENDLDIKILKLIAYLLDNNERHMNPNSEYFKMENPTFVLQYENEEICPAFIKKQVPNAN